MQPTENNASTVPGELVKNQREFSTNKKKEGSL